MPSWRANDFTRPGRARRLAGRRGPGDGRHHDVGVAAVLGRAGVAEPGADRGVGAERDAVVVEEVDELLRRVHARARARRRRCPAPASPRRRASGCCGRPCSGLTTRSRRRRPAGTRTRTPSRANRELNSAPDAPSTTSMSLSAAYSTACAKLLRVHHERVPDAHRHDLAAAGRRRCRRRRRCPPRRPPRRGRSRGCRRSSSWTRRRGRCRRRRSPSRRCRRRSRSPSSSELSLKVAIRSLRVEEGVGARLVVVAVGWADARVVRVVVDVEGAVASCSRTARRSTAPLLRQRQLARG